MSLSRKVSSLKGTTVLVLGEAVSCRVAAAWLADSGARVSLFRPGWQVPEPGSAEARFERQQENCQSADFESDNVYDLLITDSASIELFGEIPDHLRNRSVVIEITSPLPAATSFDEALVNDMVLWARSGLGYLTRDMDEAGELTTPCLPLNRQPSILAGIAAGTAGICALLALDRDDLSHRHIQIDQLELLAIMPMQPIGFAQLENRIVGAPQINRIRYPGGTLKTSNGLAYVRPVEPAHWAILLRLVGELDSIADQVEANPLILRDTFDTVDPRMREWALGLTSEEISDICQAEHVPVAPVYRPDQVIEDAHLNAREFFRTESEDQFGLNLPWLAALGKLDRQTRGRGGLGINLRKTGADLPLAGLRILDLSWAWAGPFATTLLSDLGAEVINVEWHPRASNLRRNPPFAGERGDSNNTAAWWSANQRGKFSIGVDLKTPEGKQIIKDLAARSDVVVENFSPGVVDRLGVGFDDLLEMNPRLVYVSLSAFGQVGPRSHYIGYGTQVYAAAGAGYVTSQDGQTCSQMYIPYPDPVSGLTGAFAIAAFVSNARETGCPARVDLSELEAVAAVVLEPLLDAIVDGETDEVEDSVAEERRYQVVSSIDDHFVVLITDSRNSWQDFRLALGASDNSADSIQAAAGQLEMNELLKLLKAAGLSAELIAHSLDVLDDNYLQEREFWIRDQSPEVVDSGTLIGGSLWHLDGERTQIWRGSPQLFADTSSVLIDLLDYSSDDVDDLLARHVVE